MEDCSEETIHTYRQLQEQVFAAYGGGDYTRALELLECHEHRFPDFQVYFRNWRMCFYALMGEKDQALETFRSALAAGYWWSPETLIKDGDLTSLHNEPAFQDLVMECGQRYETAQAERTPARIVHNPTGAQADQSRPLLLVLHGHSGNEHTNEERWQAAAQFGWRVVLLGSSQVVGYQAYAWDDPTRALDEVRQHLEELSQQYSFDPTCTVLAGFSQSGWLAARWVLQAQLPISRFLSLCPASTVENDLQSWVFAPAEKQPRGFIMAGERDRPWVEHARLLAAFMQDHGLPYQLRVVPDLGHDLPADFERSLPDILTFLAG